MVFTQSNTSTLPKLWISDIIAGRQLAPFFNGLYSPVTPPSGTPTGHHILSLDPDTPETIWKTIGYNLLNAGCSVSIYQVGHFNNQPLEWYLADIPVDNVVLQMLESQVSWEEWVEGLNDEPLTLKQALELAKLAILKIKDEEKLNIELDSLRRRAKVSEYTWDKKYLEPIRAKLEKALLLSSSPSDPTEARRLQLMALSQERDNDKLIDGIIAFCRRYGWSRRDVEQRLRQLKTTTTTPKSSRLKGENFLGLETESISWIFPGIIPSRGVFVIGGHAGTGKTTFAYDAAVSLLLQEEFLGEKPVKQGKVLIVSGDELPCFTQDKLIDRGMPLDNKDWEIILNWDISQWEMLEETIADLRPALVIIDSFSSIHRDPAFDENSAQAKSTIYDLEALTNSYNCGCILIHHLSKSKENKGVAKLRGSSAIAAAASVVCLMEEGKNGSRILNFPKVRGAQTESFKVSLNHSTGRYKVLTGGDSLTTKSLGNRILNFLTQDPYKRYEQGDIMKALGIPTDAASYNSVYQALSRLHRRGQIIKRPSLLGGKRKVYGVTSSLLSQLEGVQDPHPPVLDNVSSEISVSVDIQGLNNLDTQLDTQDTQLDINLTPENDIADENLSIVDGEGDSVTLTEIEIQGYECPEVNQSSVTVDNVELAQLEAQLAQLKAQLTQLEAQLGQTSSTEEQAIAPVSAEPQQLNLLEENLIQTEQLVADVPRSLSRDSFIYEVSNSFGTWENCLLVGKVGVNCWRFYNLSNPEQPIYCYNEADFELQF
jgi:DNA-binding PadR family transcriptional regulator